MRKGIMAALAVCFLLFAATADATVYTFQSYDREGYNTTDLRDLDHYYYYGWSIDNALSDALASELNSGMMIDSAVLTFTNIYDWTKEAADTLATYLLAEPPPMPSGGSAISTTLWQKYDGQSKTAVPWGTPNVLLTPVWSDPVGGSSRGLTIVYDFARLGGTILPNGTIVPGTQNILHILTAYALDGDFGFGIDPDCHYYNDGVKLTITTRAVPEPGTLALLGAGLIGLGGMGLYRRRRN